MSTRRHKFQSKAQSSLASAQLLSLSSWMSLNWLAWYEFTDHLFEIIYELYLEVQFKNGPSPQRENMPDIMAVYWYMHVII